MLFNYYINNNYLNIKFYLFYFIKRLFLYNTKSILHQRVDTKSKTYKTDYILYYKIFTKKKRIQMNYSYPVIKTKYLKLYLHSLRVIVLRVVNSYSYLKRKADNIKAIRDKFSKINNVFVEFITKYKYKDLFYNLKDVEVYSIEFKTILNSFHTTLYYFMFMNKMNNIKSYNYLNYFTYLNLNFKKHLILKYKHNFIYFQDILSNVR